MQRGQGGWGCAVEICEEGEVVLCHRNVVVGVEANMAGGSGRFGNREFGIGRSEVREGVGGWKRS